MAVTSPIPVATILQRVRQPTPAEVKQARKAANLNQTQAAQLVSTAQKTPYRSWQSYEVEEGSPQARVIPLASWELFLLLTNQHPSLQLTSRQ